jgi:hypothetical protein
MQTFIVHLEENEGIPEPWIDRFKLIKNSSDLYPSIGEIIYSVTQSPHLMKRLEFAYNAHIQGNVHGGSFS